MPSTLALAALGSALLARARADLIPTAPGPGETFDAGSACTIEWDADQSGTWTNVTIDLMTGSNTNMTRVTTVARGLDGTDAALSPYAWPCPAVDPYAAVYFYQFTNGGETAGAQWTTRFTIASPEGETVPPPNATQPGGEAIPWGTGALRAPDDGDDPGAGADGGDNDTEDTDDVDSDDDAGPAVEEADIAHSEQIAPVDLTTLRKRKADDADEGEDEGKVADKKHGGDEHGGDDDGDTGDSDDQGSHTSASAKDAKSTKTASEGGERTVSGSSASHKATSTPKTQADSADEGDDSNTPDTPTPSPTKKTQAHTTMSSSAPESTSGGADADSDADTPASSTPTKKPLGHPTASSAPAGTSGVADAADPDAAPTAPLPAPSKKPHSTSSGAPTTARAATSAANTCSCSPTEQGGLAKLMDGGAGELAVPFWLQLSVPFAIALLVLC